MRRYEGMFLFDNAVAHEWQPVDAEVRRLMERIGADLEVCLKFDERKLAYEINGRKRGTYVLTYFKAEPEKIDALEHDTHLSEPVLRALFLRTDIADDKVEELKKHPVETPLQPVSDRREGRGRDRDDGDGRDGRDGRRERRPRFNRDDDRGDRGDRGGDDRPRGRRDSDDSNSDDSKNDE
ncbi:MAG: 30S ribosomal protein S6 [Phycisphaerales bacterium]|nr:30S ribosomal protein S6 [Phycisphaerales bacterium]